MQLCAGTHRMLPLSLIVWVLRHTISLQGMTEQHKHKRKLANNHKLIFGYAVPEGEMLKSDRADFSNKAH